MCVLIFGEYFVTQLVLWKWLFFAKFPDFSLTLIKSLFFPEIYIFFGLQW